MKGGAEVNYTDTQRREHIRELQNYLRTISFYNSRIPAIIPSGVTDGETKGAVMAFQREYGLPVTGNIDEKTWNEIVRVFTEAREFLSEPLGIQVFPRDGTVLTTGSSGAAVVMLQAMLGELAATFANIRPTAITGQFDENNEQTVKFMQRVSGMEPDGKVDIFTWNRIVELFNSHRHEA